MKRHISLAALVLTVIASVGTVSTISTPAVATPVCAPGFTTVQSLNWLLRCRMVVPFAQMGVAVAAAHNAVCNTNSYWNYGPQVSIVRTRTTAEVTYICGHVEG